MDDNGGFWQEAPIKPQDFSTVFNKVDSDLEIGCKEEVKELKKRVLQEFNSLTNKNVKRATTLNATQVMNAIYNAELLFSVLRFQNKLLVERKKEPVDMKEFEVFL